MDEKLLEIMCCPETHQRLAKAGAELVDDLNKRIQAGTLVDRVDEKVAEPIDGGLIREDGKILFPIRQDIPVMLIDQGIPLGAVVSRQTKRLCPGSSLFWPSRPR